jgi:hypothetical protein
MSVTEPKDTVLQAFEPAFSGPTWSQVRVLMIGTW